MLNSFVDMTRNITLKIELKFCGTSRSQAAPEDEAMLLLALFSGLPTSEFVLAVLMLAVPWN